MKGIINLHSIPAHFNSKTFFKYLIISFLLHDLPENNAPGYLLNNSSHTKQMTYFIWKFMSIHKSWILEIFSWISGTWDTESRIFNIKNENIGVKDNTDGQYVWKG